MSEEEDFAWLRSLDAHLWETIKGRLVDDKRKLTYDDVDRIGVLIETRNLITELFCSGMFGGVGLTLYSHPVYLGVPPNRLLSIGEQNLPGPRPLTAHEHPLDVEAKTYPPRKGGGVDPYAWELFRGHTTRPDNIRWLKEYGLQTDRPLVYYEY